MATSIIYMYSLTSMIILFLASLVHLASNLDSRLCNELMNKLNFFLTQVADKVTYNAPKHTFWVLSGIVSPKQFQATDQGNFSSIHAAYSGQPIVMFAK